MNHAVLVRGGDSLRQLQAEPQHVLFRKRTGAQRVAERRPANVLHDEEVAVVLPLEVVNRGDIGMIKLAQEFGLSAESIPGVLVLKCTRWKNLNSYFAAQAQVLALVHLTHAAGADFPSKAITAKSLLLVCFLDRCNEAVA